MNRELNFFQKAIHFIITTLLLSSPALYNRFPLVYYDTGQYISTSIDLLPVNTCPMGYSFFIRAFSWQASLWPVVFMQAFLISFYIFHVIKIIFQDKDIYIKHFFIVLFLGLLSSASWFASQLMADVFAPLMLLSVFIFVSDYKNITFKIFNSILLLLIVISHYSYIYILILLVAALFLINLIYRKKLPDFKKRITRTSLLIPFILFGYFFTPFYNYTHGKSFSTSEHKHVFMVARLVGTGIMDTYLNDVCDTKDYSLCEYKDELPNMPSKFVWNSNSPFYKTGGWNSSQEEYEAILDDLLSQPKYLGMFAYTGFTYSLKQLVNFDITELKPYRRETTPYQSVEEFFPQELNDYENSRQYYGKLDFKLHNRISYLLVSISLLIIIFSWYKGLIKGQLGTLITIISLGIVFNAAVAGTFSYVVDRYQSRIVWLIIFAGLLIVLKVFWPKFNSLLKLVTNQKTNKQ